MVDCVFLLIIFFLVGTQFDESEKYHEITSADLDGRPSR